MSRWIFIVVAAMATSSWNAARADFLYTVHYDELVIPTFGTYPAEEFSFVTPVLLGDPNVGYLSLIDLVAPEPVMEGFAVDRVGLFAFVESVGQYVFTAQRAPGTSFMTGDVRTYFWAFLTPGTGALYGPGTYGLSCIYQSLPSNLCFSRVIVNAPSGAGAGTGYITVSMIPLPAAAWLLGSALGLLGWLRRRLLS